MSDLPPTSTRVNEAMRLIVATVLRSMRRTVDHLIQTHESAVNPHPQYRLRVRTVDTTTTGIAATLEVPNGSLTFPSEEVARLAPASLTVREADGTPTGVPTILEFPEDTLDYPEDAPGVARITAEALAAAIAEDLLPELAGLGLHLEPVFFSFADNGTQGFIAAYDATYGATAGGSGGGSFAYAINGSGASTPLSVAAGDVVTVTLSDATIGEGATRLLTLTRVG